MSGFHLRLRDKVTVEAASRDPDGMGGYDTSWSALTTLRARVDAISGLERGQDYGQQQLTRYRMTARMDARVTPGQRIIYGGRKLNIRFVQPLGSRSEKMTILAEEGA